MTCTSNLRSMSKDGGNLSRVRTGTSSCTQAYSEGSIGRQRYLITGRRTLDTHFDQGSSGMERARWCEGKFLCITIIDDQYCVNDEECPSTHNSRQTDIRRHQRTYPSRSYWYKALKLKDKLTVKCLVKLVSASKHQSIQRRAGI